MQDIKMNQEMNIALQEYKEKIDSALGVFFDKKIAETELQTAKEMLLKIKDFNLRGGKRLRPVLMILGHKCFSEPVEGDIINASIALELMEGFLLVHDDIMDQDKMRRGGPTMHEAYGSKDRRFGESMALMAGDIQHSFVSEIIAGSNFPKENIAKALKICGTSVARTVYGCAHELNLNPARINPLDVKEEDILDVCLLKTASYTTECPLQVGGVLAGAQGKDLKILKDYASPLGQAFQLQDDILGMFGNEQKLGKPVGSDLAEGKINLLIVKALSSCGDEDRKKILDALGNSSLKPWDFKQVQEVVKDSGSLDYSIEKAESLVDDAKDALARGDFRPEAKRFLMEIADFLIKREH